MAKVTDERAALHRENVRVSAHLDELADLAALRKPRRVLPPPELPTDPLMSATPMLPGSYPSAPQTHRAVDHPTQPATGNVFMESSDAFFGDFAADAAPAPSAPPPTRANMHVPAAHSDVYIPSEGGPVVYISPDDDAPQPGDSGEVSFNPTNTEVHEALADSAVTPTASIPETPGTPNPPPGEAINDVLDDFNW
jgi:hypothetical protein